MSFFFHILNALSEQIVLHKKQNMIGDPKCLNFFYLFFLELFLLFKKYCVL